MSSTLGEKLRQAREERGVSISEVSEQTRISSLYLQGIENDNYKALPGGIFNKGFVRTFAKYVGFDEQEALADYAKIVAENEGKEDDHLKTYRPEVLTDDRAGSSVVPTAIFAGVILTLMTVGILFLVRYIQNQPIETVVSNTPVNANTTNPANTNFATISSAVPSMETVKVQFKTTGANVSVTAVNDGKRSSILVTPEKPATFEPKQSLQLNYSKALAQAAQLTINGKSIVLPAAPANPKRSIIEVDINKGNLAQIWQSGEINVMGEQSAVEPTQAPIEAPTSAATVETRSPPTPRLTPAPVTTSTVRAETPAATGTPIVTSRPRSAATPRPSPN